jgi:hypothetical protein
MNTSMKQTSLPRCFGTLGQSGEQIPGIYAVPLLATETNYAMEQKDVTPLQH